LSYTTPFSSIQFLKLFGMNILSLDENYMYIVRHFQMDLALELVVCWSLFSGMKTTHPEILEAITTE